MKKFRFFSVAVAVVAALFVSVWAAGSVTHPFGTLNGIIPTGQKTAETSYSCRTLTGPSNSYITQITAIKGLIDVNQYCKPTTKCRVLVYRRLPNGTYVLVGSVEVPCSTNFSTNPKTITPLANTYPADGTYCFAGEVTLLNSAPVGTVCGISYTSGSATLNWAP